jgi:hypothetical protein
MFLLSESSTGYRCWNDSALAQLRHAMMAQAAAELTLVDCFGQSQSSPDSDGPNLDFYILLRQSESASCLTWAS